MKRFFIGLICLLSCVLGQTETQGNLVSARVDSLYLPAFIPGEGGMCIRYRLEKENLSVAVLTHEAKVSREVPWEQVRPHFYALDAALRDPTVSLTELRAIGLAFWASHIDTSVVKFEGKHFLVTPDGPLLSLAWAGIPHPHSGYMADHMVCRTVLRGMLAQTIQPPKAPGQLVYAAVNHAATATIGSTVYQRFSGRLDTGKAVRYERYISRAPLANLLYLGLPLRRDTISGMTGLGFSNGMLPSIDIARLRLRSDLAFLPSTNTEPTQAKAASELIDAFAKAGCRSVIISHWPQTETRIQDGFFLRLKEGIRYDEALHAAQTQYRATAFGERRHPYYWAGLSLVGEVGATKKESVWWIWVLTLLLSGILLRAWLLRWKRGN
ncbi:MAG: CHAT domain-containing protein [Bacteroidia bacterium]